MFIRQKKIKDKYYAYLVKNKWTKKGPRQKVTKYLGRVFEFSPQRAITFEEFIGDINRFNAYDLVEKAVCYELYLHGFIQKKGVMVKDDFKVNLATCKVKKAGKAAVLKINNDFLCDFTLKNLLRFTSNKDKEETAKDLATAFIQAGIPVDEQIFIKVFELIYSSGQTKLLKAPENRVIIVSGAPGTGKTTLSKKIAEKLSFEYIDVNELISQNNMSAGFDADRKCLIVEENKLEAFLIDRLKKSSKAVVDSHMSHIISPDLADLCIITHTSIEILRKRLENRGYLKKKIDENIQSEIFDVCGQEAFEKGHNILEVNTDDKLDMDDVLEKINRKVISSLQTVD
ncbi:MAG: AAA family ATPase [Nanobdellota archaeon]